MAVALRRDEVDVWSTQLGARSLYAQNRGVSLARDSANDFSGNFTDQNNSLPSSVPVHTGSSSSRPQHGVERPVSASQPNRRNLATAQIPTLLDVKASLHSAMLRTIQPGRVPAKEVAHKIEASQHTVEAMRQNGPPDAMARLVLACIAYPEFRGEVVRIMGLERDLDPDFQKDFSELMRRVL